MPIQDLPRCSLAHLPTPLEPLPSLSKKLGGPKLLVKRDDQTGLALGGNKTRKLEFLLGQALAEHADVVLTAGAAQSNHCRQTAAAAARVGLACELVLGGQPPETPAGNVLLDQILGARIHWTGPERRGERLGEVAEGLRAQGRRPYVIPYGGSNEVGAVGYAVAMEELAAQLAAAHQQVDAIVFASSSGGTQAGLAAGARAAGFTAPIIGIHIDKGDPSDAPYEVALADLAGRTAKRMGVAAAFAPGDFVVNNDYLGGGYGVVGDLEREAISLMAKVEGLLLDPVYTGRAFGGLLDMLRRRTFSPAETVLFWHTGGAPALFAYAADLNVR